MDARKHLPGIAMQINTTVGDREIAPPSNLAGVDLAFAALEAHQLQVCHKSSCGQQPVIDDTDDVLNAHVPSAGNDLLGSFKAVPPTCAPPGRVPPDPSQAHGRHKGPARHLPQSAVV